MRYTVLGAVWCLLLLVLSPAAFAASDVKIKYEKPTKEYVQVKQEIAATKILPEMVDYVRTTFDLQAPLRIAFTNGGIDEGPYYDSEERTIFMPYDFWLAAADEFMDADKTLKDANEIMHLSAAVVTHALAHEIGHAFIDILELPVTGKEENVADEFAVFLLMESLDDGKDIAQVAADFFSIEGMKQEEITDEDVFDEHALDDQRFFTTLCLVYGLSPDKEDAEELKELGANEERLEICEYEAERRAYAWDFLLSGFRYKNMGAKK